MWAESLGPFCIQGLHARPEKNRHRTLRLNTRFCIGHQSISLPSEWWGTRRGTGLATGDPGARAFLGYRLTVNSPQTEGSRDFKGKWGVGGGEQGPPGLEQGFPGGSDGKESACSLRDLGSNPGLGKASGEGNDYPL